ncbi:MAG: peptidoglycan-associated lipoprotein Pal [Proteobacteria bacterium]|nr:peptidoglycan-associated lipoprotein Pal [Pseudomonadota bacterium]
MKKIILLISLALFITACGDKIKPDSDTIDGDPAATSDGGATAGGIGGDGVGGGTALEGGKVVSYAAGAIDDPDNVLSEKVVYFAFDNDSVSDDYIELVKHHGKYLSLNTGARVRLEGHADELGTREYNVALGERRALAVKQVLLYEGATNGQISIISYGEEKPMEFGHDEESMSLNRRVEIVYE